MRGRRIGIDGTGTAAEACAAFFTDGVAAGNTGGNIHGDNDVRTADADPGTYRPHAHAPPLGDATTDGNRDVCTAFANVHQDAHCGACNRRGAREHRDVHAGLRA